MKGKNICEKIGLEPLANFSFDDLIVSLNYAQKDTRLHDALVTIEKEIELRKILASCLL